MKTAGGLLAITLAALISLPQAAQARPRLGPGLLLSPLAVVGGVARAAIGSRKARAHRAYKHRHRVRRERPAVRQARDKAPPRPAVVAPATSTPPAAIAAAPAAAAAAVPAGAAAAVAASAWAGPLFWPHAFDDIFDYVFARPGGGEVWSRGFGDVLAGLFATPASDAAIRRAAHAERGMEPAWENLCGSETPKASTIAFIRERITLKPEQEAALNELAAALSRAAERIEQACPERRPATASERLHMMIARLAAMRQAVVTVQQPLRNLYEQLDDAQKAALDGSAGEAAEKTAGAKPDESCAAPASLPQRELERVLKPMPAQRAEFERFYRTAMGLDRFVASTCPERPLRTAPARLEAIKDRLGVLRYAATTLSPAYDGFYRSLTDAQRARLGALTQDRTAETQR